MTVVSDGGRIERARMEREENEEQREDLNLLRNKEYIKTPFRDANGRPAQKGFYKTPGGNIIFIDQYTKSADKLRVEDKRELRFMDRMEMTTLIYIPLHEIERYSSWLDITASLFRRDLEAKRRELEIRVEST